MPNNRIKKYHPLDFDKDISIGIKLPYSNTYSSFNSTINYVSGSILKNSSISLFEKTYTTTDQTKYNLINLILTKKGERLMHPDFGTSISNFMFNPIDLTLRTKLKDSLTKDIKYWMPYIIINDIDVGLTDEDVDKHEIKIKISYKNNEFDDPNVINFTFGDSITFNIE